MRELEKENARLKRLLAESAIEIAAMKEVLAKKVVSASQRREAVGMLKQMEVSERCSCQLVGLSRPGFHYQERKSDGALLEKLKAIAREHPRYGYRRACALVTRSGEQINHKRVHRMWKQAQLSLPLRRPRKRRVGSSGMRCSQALFLSHVWTYDFVFSMK